MHSLYVAPSPGRRCKVTFPRLWKGTMSINAVADVDVHQMPLPDAMTPAQERSSVAIELSPDDLEQLLPVPVETDTEDLAHSGVGSGNGKSPSRAPARSMPIPPFATEAERTNLDGGDVRDSSRWAKDSHARPTEQA